MYQWYLPTRVVTPNLYYVAVQVLDFILGESHSHANILMAAKRNKQLVIRRY